MANKMAYAYPRNPYKQKKPTVFPRNAGDIKRNVKDLPKSVLALFGKRKYFESGRKGFPQVQAAQEDLMGNIQKRRKKMQGMFK